MTRFCFLAVLIALTSPAVLTSPAHAGKSISFNVGSHRVHIAKHCRSISCTSMSISKNPDWRRKRKRYDDARDTAPPPKPVAPASQAVSPPVPQTVSPPVPPVPVAPPATTAPAKTIVTAPPPAVYTQAASRSHIVAPPPPPPPPVQPVSIPVPPPPAAKPVEAARPAPQVERVSHQAEEEPSDSPIGDWQTEAKGTVRIAKCGNALCGYALSPSSNEKAEAILINMKPKTERQWTGSVYSQTSGETYFGTMSMRGINTLRVEACALGRFYCSGNNWSRLTRRADSLVTSWQTLSGSRS